MSASNQLPRRTLLGASTLALAAPALMATALILAAVLFGEMSWKNAGRVMRHATVRSGMVQFIPAIIR